MKKIIQIFIIVHILISIGYADLTEKQMKQYWESSRAKIMLEYLKKDLERDWLITLNLKKENINSSLQNAINTFVNNPKYLEEYKDTFLSFDYSIYEGLKKFYNTNLGKKYKNLMQTLDYLTPGDSRSKYREVDGTLTYLTNKDISNKYNKIMSSKNISKRKLKFISKLIEELNLIDMKVNYIKEFALFKYQSVYPEKNVTNEMINRLIIKYKTNIEDHEHKSLVVLLYNFSEENLEKLLDIESNKTLSIELEYIYKASITFSTQSYLDLKNNFKSLIIMRSCQDYTIKSKWYPKDCKLEWLSKVEEIEK